MSNKIVLIGGGGHCKSVINTLCRLRTYDEIAVIDKDYPQIKNVFEIPIVGNDDKLLELKEQGYHDAFITVGSIKSTLLRHSLFEKAICLGFHVPCIVDTSAQVSKYAALEEGVFVGQNAVINAGTRISKMAIINTGAIIEHECTIGDYSHISVGAKLCGNVSVGNDVLIGAGAIVIQNVNIGNSVLVGAGSTVLRDVSENQTVVGFVKKLM